jgi:hypothetical protein
MKMITIKSRKIVGVDLSETINSMYRNSIYRKVSQEINLHCNDRLQNIIRDNFGRLKSHLETDLFVNSSRWQDDPGREWRG